MCYIIAKDVNKHGCIAFKTRLGKATAELTKELNRIAPRRGIQIVTISRPVAYGEYAVGSDLGETIDKSMGQSPLTYFL